MGLVSLLIFKKTGKPEKRAFLTWILPLFATAGLWYRTWLLTGVPVTSVYANFFEKIGFKVKYPYNFSHVIGDPSVLSRGEKIHRLLERLKGVLISPVGEDMEHVIIAWGTVLVTALLLFWIFQVITRFIKHQQISQLDFFDGFLMITLLIGSAASIYTLAQIDGNYFILVYAVAAISTVRITGYWLKIRRDRKHCRSYNRQCSSGNEKDPQVRHLFTGRSILSLQYPDRILYQLGRMPGLYLF